jgi:hypothetical protein
MLKDPVQELYGKRRFLRLRSPNQAVREALSLVHRMMQLFSRKHVREGIAA